MLVRLLPLRPDLLGQVLHRRDVEAPVALPQGLVAEDVDRLEDREPAAGPEYPVELDECGSLVHEVDQHRARRRDVHGRVRKRQVVGGGAEELAPLRYAQVTGYAPALVEEILGDVAEDHPAALADELDRAEADQAVARADVEHDVAVADVRVLEHAAAELLEVRQLPGELLGIAAVPVLEQPPSPPVPFRAHPLEVAFKGRSVSCGGSSSSSLWRSLPRRRPRRATSSTRSRSSSR